MITFIAFSLVVGLGGTLVTSTWWLGYGRYMDRAQLPFTPERKALKARQKALTAHREKLALEAEVKRIKNTDYMTSDDWTALYNNEGRKELE